MTPSTVIDSVRIDADAATPRVVIGGPAPRPEALRLVGPRWQGEVAVSVDTERDDRWTATLPLTASRWAGPNLPLPAGRYRVHVDDRADAAVDSALPEAVLLEQLLRVEFAATSTLEVIVSAPLTDDERGAAAQRRLESEYRSTDAAPLNAVFFESFYGTSASCNPRAIDRALARVAPDVQRYWSVVDASVAVPEGGIRLIEGSTEWWRVRGAARLLVVNDWLRKRFRRRGFQTVLQTWHGTPLKRIALGRPGVRLRAAVATVLERARWGVMLSQNPHSTRVFRRSYAFFGPIWELGYPRDDLLVDGTGDEIRERLGIPAAHTVLLYAPTWRDDRPDEVDHLDVARFAAGLGEHHTVLVRGHSRTLQPGTDVRAPGVIDVTSYPDVADLFLAADALITDYSSVMFDFTVTGKPVLFHTPDFADYRDRIRGFTFDLLTSAPGPVVDSAEALAALVHDLPSVAREYAAAYRAWQQRFNPRDDGNAAERVVRRLLERRSIG